MSKEIYLYSEDKKYKCAVELADTYNRFGCPVRSMIILTEERPDGTYVIAQAIDRILETEKDKQISDLQHRLKVAAKALSKAVNDKCNAENIIAESIVGKGAKVAVPKKEQWYLEQSEKEIKGEKNE